MKLFLKSIHLSRDDIPRDYPFSVPTIATLERIELTSAVTVFAGENGTGKSTLLEGIAAGIDAIGVRGDDAGTAVTLAHARELGERLAFEWSKRTRQGFFLRAEDFFDFCKRMARTVEELHATADDFDQRFSGYGRQLARGTALGQRNALINTYGEDLNTLSHGESFLRFFGARFTGPGLYLLDEPDTALSAQSVLGLLAMLKDMVAKGAQFIIATHSPMLMAFPDATILSFDHAPIHDVIFDEVEQITLMKEFLAHPQAFLRRL